MPQYQLKALTAFGAPGHTAAPPALPGGQGRATQGQDSGREVAGLATATPSPEPGPGGPSWL